MRTNLVKKKTLLQVYKSNYKFTLLWNNKFFIMSHPPTGIVIVVHLVFHVPDLIICRRKEFYDLWKPNQSNFDLLDEIIKKKKFLLELL